MGVIVAATHHAAKCSVVATAVGRSTAKHKPVEAKGTDSHTDMQVGPKAVESETKCLEQLANRCTEADEKPTSGCPFCGP